jgi:hypothetical protein
MNKIIMIIALVLSVNVFASEFNSCSISQSVISCGGVSMKDSGCNITCASALGYESLCTPSECHQLPEDHSVDYICSQKNSTCIVSHDGHIYIYNESSCFCD